jgi:hypothetical protein
MIHRVPSAMEPKFTCNIQLEPQHDSVFVNALFFRREMIVFPLLVGIVSALSLSIDQLFQHYSVGSTVLLSSFVIFTGLWVLSYRQKNFLISEAGNFCLLGNRF